MEGHLAPVPGGVTMLFNFDNFVYSDHQGKNFHVTSSGWEEVKVEPLEPVQGSSTVQLNPAEVSAEMEGISRKLHSPEGRGIQKA